MSDNKLPENKEEDIWDLLLPKGEKSKEIMLNLVGTFSGSSLLEEAQYDVIAKTLIVKFRAKTIRYIYFDLPKKTAESLFASESAGKFFSEKIKNKFSFTKLEPPAPKKEKKK